MTRRPGIDRLRGREPGLRRQVGRSLAQGTAVPRSRDGRLDQLRPVPSDLQRGVRVHHPRPAARAGAHALTRARFQKESTGHDYARCGRPRAHEARSGRLHRPAALKRAHPPGAGGRAPSDVARSSSAAEMPIRRLRSTSAASAAGTARWSSRASTRSHSRNSCGMRRRSGPRSSRLPRSSGVCWKQDPRRWRPTRSGAWIRRIRSLMFRRPPPSASG